MAKASSQLSVSESWQQIADATQSFFISVLGGDIFLVWSATEPSAEALGHPFTTADSYAENDTTENVWVRAKRGSATVVVSKE